MKPFEYAAPKTLKEATGLLGDTWGDTELLAGGTDLVTCLKQEITRPQRVVSLKNIPELRGIKSDKAAITLGAMTTLRELVAHRAVQKNFPSLITAAKNIASPQMLAMGTVGGDLCQRPRCWYFRNGLGLLGKDADGALARNGENRYHAVFGTEGPSLFVSASSFGPPLIALGASLTAEGPAGKTRKIPAAEFFRAPKSEGERETALRPNEVLTLISIPIQGLANEVYEVRHRHGLDWPYVTAAVAFTRKNQSISNARVVLGHVAATPWVAAAAAEALNGAQLDERVAAKCGEAAVQGAKPLSGNEYKLQLVKAAVKRAVLAAAAV